jgi:hypothetical protein
MKKWTILFLLISSPTYAQEEVNKVPDYISWGTAAVNPTVALVKALRSEDKKCNLGKLAISEIIANTSVLTIQHFVISARPCIGCDSHGFPSGHSANSVVGISKNNWYIGITTAWGTGELRRAANRHTIPQILAGWTIGGLSELAGQKLLRCKDD